MKQTANSMKQRANPKNQRAIATGWRRLIASPKLQIFSHTRATEYRSLLRKMTYKNKASYNLPLLYLYLPPFMRPHSFFFFLFSFFFFREVWPNLFGTPLFQTVGCPHQCGTHPAPEAVFRPVSLTHTLAHSHTHNLEIRECQQSDFAYSLFALFHS